MLHVVGLSNTIADPQQETSSVSLYAQYISEREGKHILEHAQGFATYMFMEKGCYIEDIFVQKEYRKTGVAAHLADQIVEIAKEKGYTKLFGSVVPSANNSTESLEVLLAYGFRLDNTSNNFILMVKEI